jgi:signal transduction histidine kinase
MMGMIVTGFGFRDILVNKIFNLNSAILLTILKPTVLMIFLQMTSTFLTLRINSPKLNQWIHATMFSAGFITLLSLHPTLGKFAITAGDRIVFVGMILSSLAAFRCYRNKVSLSGYFSSATTILILSNLPLLITTITTRKYSVFEMNLIPVGQSIEMLILSMALISKYRRIDEARAGAEIEASKSEELKTMLRVLSHDLNNPLTVVISYARIGVKKAQLAASDEFTTIFNKILKASLNQSAIIEHIKIMRAIEDGKATLNLSPVSLLEVVRQAESTFEKKLQEKNLTFNYDSDFLEKCNVLAEPTSLNHNVINNLISNAIKFSHPGSSIDLFAEAHNDQIKITVVDHGVGMPKELIDKVFRTDAPTSRTGTGGETGTGFGMPVVKTYMDHFGGSIHIESQTEKESPSSHGTKVTLEFKKAA